MSRKFAIDIDWERLERGLPEERATFGAIGLRVDGTWLTEAYDVFVRRVRQKVHLSGYQLAQWLAWNWWRLRWETRRPLLNWRMAHRFTTIGGGYVWPNVDCVSDGERVLLQSFPAPSRGAEPLRYVAEVREALTASEFQAGVGQFVELVLEQLRTEGIQGSNLERIWAYVNEEQSDPDSVWYRRLEAAMGFDPDEAAEEVVNALINEGEALGNNGVAELATGASREEPALSFNEIRDLAASAGYETRLASIPRAPAAALDAQGASNPAWQVGEDVARALRDQEGLGGGHLSDQRLAELAGTDPAVLNGGGADVPFSFALNGGGATARIVLQSPIVISRRFALARLVGDRILQESQEPFIPVMRSYSYRQKLQRAFAAELLCPFKQASEQLDAELTEESQERVANEYRVSPMLVRTQLVNKGVLGRQVLDDF